jgi:3',5'-cyclic AMP phosphodiesterase CpdA
VSLTRREALLLGGAALLAAGCGSARSTAADSGSTLASTWSDPGGTGTLAPGPGESLVARTELGPVRATDGVIATLAHVTDAHVLDASSPARVPFLDRLGAPFESTFRPQETLTAQVLAGAARAIRALGPDAVIQGGDLIDNDQQNELTWALAALRGGLVRPDHYFGVQLASDPDPFYYRPDLDAPQHPGLLARASRPFLSVGTGARVYPVLGDHDILVAGEIVPTAETRALAVGDEALWELPSGLSLPPGASLTAGGSPDGPPLPGLVNGFLARALAGPKVRVPADPSRHEMDAAELVARLREAAEETIARLHQAAGHTIARLHQVAGQTGGHLRGVTPPTEPGTRATELPSLDYQADVGPNLRVIVLDLARRGGGSGGLVRPDQPGWLASQLDQAEASGRWVIVVSHQPLASSDGGDALLSLLDDNRHVIAALSGHTHRNSIAPRAGYWLISTASLIDYPQQARALRVLRTAGGGVAIQTWMLDHAFGGDLGTISRELAYLDAQGGRPKGFAGGRLDRNVTLYRAAA